VSTTSAICTAADIYESFAGGEEATKMADAVRAVAVLHKPMEWYEECADHTVGADEDAYWEVHRYIGDNGLVVCDDTRQPDVCRECTPEGADGDTVDPVAYPCPTLRKVAEALDVAVGGGEK
jgi:hypothetical protein